MTGDDVCLPDAAVHLLGKLGWRRDGAASGLVFEHQEAHALGGRWTLRQIDQHAARMTCPTGIAVQSAMGVPSHAYTMWLRAVDTPHE